MGITIDRILLDHQGEQTHGLVFLPGTESENRKCFGVFSHGYTSHKGDLLQWAQRMAESGAAAVIFDQPGHFLGNYSEVPDFELYKRTAQDLFVLAFEQLKARYVELFPLRQDDVLAPNLQLVLGGHSLGALMALKAMELPFFGPFKHLRAFCVGLGIPPEDTVHIFKTPLFESTMVARKQLVSSEIPPEKMFPWILETKKKLTLSGKKIHLVCGKDDVVVGQGGVTRMKELLESHDNFVTVEEPPKLSHHRPELAAGILRIWLKSLGILA